MARSVSIRLGTEGKAQVKADFDDIASSGDVAAKRWKRSFEQAGDDVEAAMRRQANAAAKLAAITPQTSIQMRISDANSTGFGQWENSARQSAAAFRELLAAEEQLEVRAKALRAAIDPAAGAQDRFNAEMAEARTLVSAGAISLDEYVAKLRMERAALDAAVVGHNRSATAAGGNRAALAGLSFQAQDAFTQISMGTNVLSVLAIQGGQAAGQLIYMEGKLGSVAKFLVGPWGLAITGGLLVLGALTNGMFDAGNASDDLKARQSALGAELDRTTGKVKEQVNWLSILAGARATEAEAQKAATAYQSARTRLQVGGLSAGQIFSPDEGGGRWIDSVSPGGRTIINQQLGRYNGGAGSGINAEELVRNLQAAAKLDPSMREAVKQIEQLAFGVNDASEKSKGLQIQMARIAVATGNATAAQKALIATTTEGLGNDKEMIEAKAKLAGATNAMDRANAQHALALREADDAYERSKKTDADKAKLLAARTKAERDLNLAQDASRKTGQAHAQTLARQATAMEVNASAALDLAEAYLKGGDAAMRAEAARKGLTDATRKGIDGEAQTRRQLDIMIGDSVVNGAKSVAQLREETAARALVNAQVAAGTLPISQLNRTLSDEAALRPLLKLQTLAQGDALKILTRVIAEYRQALSDAHDEEAKGAAAQAIDAAKSRVAEIKASILDLSKSPEDQAVAAARRAANAEADAGKFSAPDRKALADQRALEAVAQSRQSQAKYILDTLRGQEDSITLAQRELELAGANDNYRTTELEKLRLSLDLRRRFPEMEQENIDKIMQGVDAQAAINAKLEMTKNAIAEVRDFGVEFVDTVLSPDTWSSWGNAGKVILNSLKTEFIKLALLNPLKNLINGDDKLSTIGSILSNIGGLFGGSSSAASTSPTYGTSGLLAGNAAGTEYWSGGASLVGENGPEIVDMPRGSRVTPAGETRRLLAGGAQQVQVAIHVAANDYFDAKVASISGGQLQAAAPGIAAGAASLSASDAARQRRRRIPGR